MNDFISFSKLHRLSREIIVTEKIDGTNAQIYIGDNGEFSVGSRNRWIYPEKGKDNSGFAAWAHDNKNELLKLGPGRHFGEWWGKGIQRGYGKEEKIFSLFNTERWSDSRPSCCSVVPVLYKGPFDTNNIDAVLEKLKVSGSLAAPGFMKPEGIVIFHTVSGIGFKKTIENDHTIKSMVNNG